jgi:hypothetical protein
MTNKQCSYKDLARSNISTSWRSTEEEHREAGELTWPEEGKKKEQKSL